MIDATIVRAHQHASGARGGQANQNLGRSSGGLSSKIHAKVDALGMPLEFIISPGQAHEINYAYDLLDSSVNCNYLLADRGYDSNDLRSELLNRSIIPIIPGKSNRLTPIEYDKHTYKERNVIERFFCKMKHFRRIATRYDKTTAMFAGALSVVSIILWLRF